MGAIDPVPDTSDLPYHRYDLNAPPTPPTTRPVLTWQRWLLATGLVVVLVAGAFVLFIVSLGMALSCMDSCESGTNDTAIVAAVASVVVFLATSVAAGRTLRRWWAWLTPIWLVAGFVSLMLLGEAAGSL